MSQSDLAATYAALPYETTPFAETHPANLAVLGRLFGLETAPPEGCRVLEIGCAAGGNLIPAAYYHPDSEFVGIDLSPDQIAAGQGLAAAAGVTNVRLIAADLMTFETEGPFDYIIAHGFFSWVPPAVREQLLARCREWLAPHGLAYVSYNTLPGWRLRGMLRDMLLYHTRGEAPAPDKVAAAHDFLDFLARGTAGSEAYGARYLRQEAEYLRKAHPSYLFHEYLEQTNDPLLFRDFVDLAQGHGLKYVCDTDLRTLFPSTLGDAVAAALDPIDDPLEAEQYLDFLVTRHFRQSLLCHEEQQLTREWDLERFDSLAFYADLTPPPKLDLRRAKEQPFTGPSGDRFPVAHPLTKAALGVLGERYADAIPFEVMQAEAARRVAAAGGTAFAGQTEHLFGELFSLIVHQAVGVALAPRSFATALAARPLATPLARAQAPFGHAATARHTTVRLDPFAARLLLLLDGERDAEALAAQLTAEVEGGALALPGVDPRRLGGAVRENVRRLLALFARNGLLRPA